MWHAEIFQKRNPTIADKICYGYIKVPNGIYEWYGLIQKYAEFCHAHSVSLPNFQHNRNRSRQSE